MKKYSFLIITAFFVCFTSCTELEIPPMNVIQDKDVFTSEEGISSYMARIYSEMPIEDFRYSPATGFNTFFYGPPGAITGEALSRDQGSGTESFAYWAYAYNLIRECNYFIETLPEYQDNFTEEKVKNWLGEAYLIRGVAYFSLVKRYGGVPLVDKVLTEGASIEELTASVEELQIPRSSEEAVWDFVAADFNRAYENLPATNTRGRATKYAAAGFNSRAMLYAGSIAKYNTIELVEDGERIVGIPSGRASDYFKASYDAANLLEGNFQLYRNSWSAGNPEAQYQNFIDLFFDASSAENIFVKQYQVPESVHAYDSQNLPKQLSGSSSVASETNPTLDLVELYDGFEKNDEGTIKVFDDQGHYIMFDERMDIFANAEPRLRATVIFAGDELKGEAIDIRRGIYTGDSSMGIDPILPEGSTANYPSNVIVSSATAPQTPYALPNGSSLNPAGESGVFTSRNAGGSVSGFSVRKYIDPDLATASVAPNMSEQSWIELRYAEVLLNQAEAAYELFLAGQGANYATEALTIINDIRDRAGAETIASSADFNLESIRSERRKELAFENKTYWDFRRWRIYDEEQNQTLYRTLMPFYVADAGKYIFDARFDERNYRYTWDPRWYYNAIPQGAISKNPNLTQNPGY
ncbi:MAG: RagB/SusD family nutrient uptake outer membrane protein [Cytophagaceae bacterium]|nr:RagB/SusD family nutrient uptake outer membrane protein [Cytophagaceae bacterium]|tara:strand:- start:577 stop:2493 length:1917 start_codon:yes stop_codon:yes gene_type:complete